MPESGRRALAAIETFKRKYAAKYAKGVVRLTRGADALLAFQGFPVGRWPRLRISNPIERALAAVRRRAAGSGRVTRFQPWRIQIVLRQAYTEPVPLRRKTMGMETHGFHLFSKY